MRIVIYIGYHDPAWNPTMINTTGLGGTEQCALNLAKQFATEHEVYVVGDVLEGEFDNVMYLTTHNAINTIKAKYIDCVIGVSYINYLLVLKDLNFTHSIFWVHNTDFHPWHNGTRLANAGRYLLRHPKMSGIVCLTKWHKNKFIEQFPESESKIKVIGNGVDVNSFAKVSEKLPNSFIYTSHSERGLNIILDEWEELKAKINTTKIPPQLHIATPKYGLEYFNEHFAERVAKSDDIIFYGSLCRSELYELMAKCEYWYYPTNYEETFCITALEMLGHHVKPITSANAGLSETLFNFNLSDFAESLPKKEVDAYVSKCSWSNKKLDWNSYIFDMSNKSSMETESPIKLNSIDCVYVVSLEASSELQKKYSDAIKTKLIPGFEGQIVIKLAVNGALVTSTWLKENDYELYDWELKDSGNDWWDRPLNPGSIGNSISQHKIWKHAHENNFQNIIVLEEDFKVNSPLTDELVGELPYDYELFYLGRNPLYDWGEDTPVDGSKNIVKPAPSYNAHAYMLSATGIKSLLNQNFNKYIMPPDDFLICCYAKHKRKDLHFIVNDLKAYATTNDNELVSQNRESNTTGPRLDLSSKKHPELYSYWDDTEAWKKRFVAYSARTKEWELIMDEPFDNCFSMPLFTAEFCEKIKEEAEHAESWTTDRHEFYPTTDMLLETISLDRVYYEILKEFAMPAAIHAFRLEGLGWDKMASEDFLAKYLPDAQGHLSLHHDHSNITALVTLSHGDDYEGGGTWFSHQKKLVKEKQGHVSIHPGNITHKHGARATTKGSRYIIVSFMKNLHFMKD